MIYIKACRCYICGNLFELKKKGYTIANKYVTYTNIFMDTCNVKNKIAICEECSKIMFNYIAHERNKKENEKRDCEGVEMTNQEQYELIWEKAEKYDRLVEALNKIRAEITDLAEADAYGDYQQGFSFGLMRAVQVINKYKESEK